MREIFVENDTLDKLTVFNGSTSLSDDSDQVEVNILSFEVSNVKNRLDSKLGVLFLALAHNLGSKCSHSALSKELVVVLGNVNLI